MKKSILLLLLIGMVIFTLGCSSQHPSENNMTNSTNPIEKPSDFQGMKDEESVAEDLISPEKNTITTMEGLETAIQNSDISEKRHYNAIAAFITGDIESLAKYTNVDPSYLSMLKTVKITEFKVGRSETQHFSLDFSFTVNESDCSAFPSGEYNYFIDDSPVSWHSYDEAVFDEELADLEIIMTLLPSATISFENSAPQLYEERFNICAPYFIMQMENYYNGVGANETILAQRMYEFFGIEGFIPDEEYFKTVNDTYQLTDSGKSTGLAVVDRIAEVRKVSDNIVEVDVCFFADNATLCLTHKTTYTLEKGNFAYGYRLLNARVTENYNLDPMWFNS